jgi:hypothetical protein
MEIPKLPDKSEADVTHPLTAAFKNDIVQLITL